MSGAGSKWKLSGDAVAGLLLVAGAGLAMIAANGPFSALYDGFLDTPLVVKIGETLELDKPLLLWINDGLMAVFFLLIGLEVKRELFIGRLSRRDTAMLPAIGAVGGMVVPSLVYVLVNVNDPTALQGWAIPAATDIAFAIGVLALLGPRVPPALTVFLLALAIIDDLGAIVIIALFYSGDLAFASLALAHGALAVLFVLNRLGVRRLTPFLLVGSLLWLFVLKSGVHATLAGVAIAFAIPLRASDTGRDPAHELEEGLRPWVLFAIMPLFAFANAGVTLGGMGVGDFFDSLTLGIVAGLVVGKPLGVLGFCWLAVRRGWARLPEGSDWRQLAGVASLCGIGFTMSLFIGSLAFEHVADVDVFIGNRLGILLGSTLSALLGVAILVTGQRRSS